MGGKQRGVDEYTWLWDRGFPDYDALLASEVKKLAGADADVTRRAELERVAQRLLDRVRDREARPEEERQARELLKSSGVEDGVGNARVRLLEAAEKMAGKGDERGMANQN